MIDYFLADDLSGALDAAAAFHGVGRRVRIVLSADSWLAEPDDDVVGVTTETRNAAPADAAAAVTRAFARAHSQGARLVYKKIDSTLRGPVAAELEALAQALPETRILFAPANPRAGRTVSGGVLFVHGVPVAETEFGRDPVSPVRVSAVAAFIGELPRLKVEIPDTETSGDLEAAVSTLVRSGNAWLAVGSGALARAVAAVDSRVRLREKVQPATATKTAIAPVAHAVLLLSGSAHRANREQAAVLALQLGVEVRELRADAPHVALNAAREDLTRARVAILLAEEERRESRELLGAITQVATALVRGGGIRHIFATGGETASAVCTQLGVTALVFEREIEIGLSLSRARYSEGELYLAVKPGGFGDDETWRRAWEALANRT